MKSEGHKALLIALGASPEGESENEQTDAMSPEETKSKASEEMLAAISKNDSKALAAALEAFTMACTYPEEESEEE